MTVTMGTVTTGAAATGTTAAGIAPTETAGSGRAGARGFADAAELDRLLGDPYGCDTPFTASHVAELDSAERFPAEICALLDGVGLPAHYVPAGHGGALASYEALIDIVRVVARRDLTVAVAHAKTFLGAASVWVAGRPDQAAALAADVAGGTVVSWALTEPDRGSDLLAGRVAAVPTAGGYRVDGTKWLINNATRASVICLQARTDPAGGPRGFSLLLVDKRTLDAGGYAHTPKVPTHGIRGADISGITFHGARVPAGALVGAEGAGIEIVLKALQLTRTLCVSLSLGAADHALALAHRFTAGRELYGGRLIDLANVRRSLGAAYAMLFTMEAVATMATRSVHVFPDEMAVVSATAKAAVPTIAEQLIMVCGELLGARAFMTGVYAEGAFQRVERDHRIVGIFDGSTLVNQQVLINHFPVLGRGYRAASPDEAALATAATPHGPLPDADLSRLSLTSRTGCSLVASLPSAVAALRARAADGSVAPETVVLAERLLAGCDDLHRELRARRPAGRDVPAAAFALAQRFERAFATAAVIRMWLAARPASDDPLWAGGRWLRAALTYLADGTRPATGGDAFDSLLDAVTETGSTSVTGAVSAWGSPR